MHEHIHRCQGGSHVFELASKNDAIGQSKFMRYALQSLAIIILHLEGITANDEKTNIGTIFVQLRSNAQENSPALPGAQAADHADYHIPIEMPYCCRNDSLSIFRSKRPVSIPLWTTIA